MRRNAFTLSLLFLFGLALFSPIPSSADGLVPCGRNTDDPTTTINETAVCTLCHVIVGGKNIIDWGMRVMVAIGLVVITAMGIWYIVSSGNDSMISQAKSGIKATLIGIAVMLGAWLLIHTTLLLLAQETDPSKNPIIGLQVVNGFQFSCDTQSLANTGASSSATGATGSSSGGSSSSGGAACEDISAAKSRISSGGTVCNGTGSCPSCNTAAFDSFISTYGGAAGISLPFIRGLIARESSCNPSSVKNESNGTKSCGLMQVNTGASSYTCSQLQDPETGIKEGVRILAAAFGSARSLSSSYGSTVTVEELAAAIHNAGAGQSSASVDCTVSSGWKTMPKWGCPINPGTAEFNACRIRDYACNVGKCK